MSDEQGELNFADAPMSLATKRAEKAEDGRLWKPRDLLIDLLRDIDNGRLSPQAMVVMHKTTHTDNSYDIVTLSCGGANRHELIGVAYEGIKTIMEY